MDSDIKSYYEELELYKNRHGKNYCYHRRYRVYTKNVMVAYRRENGGTIDEAILQIRVDLKSDNGGIQC